MTGGLRLSHQFAHAFGVGWGVGDNDHLMASRYRVDSLANLIQFANKAFDRERGQVDDVGTIGFGEIDGQSEATMIEPR